MWRIELWRIELWRVEGRVVRARCVRAQSVETVASAPVVASDRSGSSTRGRDTHGSLATQVDKKVWRAEVEGPVGSRGVEIVEKVVEVAGTDAKELEDGRPAQEDCERTQRPREVLSLELDTKEAVNTSW